MALDRPVRATATTTASRSTRPARRTATTTRAGRTPATRSCTPTGRSRRCRSRSSSSRATSTTPRSGWPPSTSSSDRPDDAARLRREARAPVRARQRAVLVGGRGDLLPRPRRREAPDRDRRLERRAPAACRASCRSTGRARVVERLMARRHVVRLGHPDAVVGPRRLQPVQLPHGLGLAARQRDHRRRVRATTASTTRRPRSPAASSTRRAVPGQPAARAVRRPAAPGRQLPGPVPRRQRAAGLGGRRDHPVRRDPGRDPRPLRRVGGRGSTSIRRCPTGCPS